MVPSAGAADVVCGTGTVGPAVFTAAGRLNAVVVSGWRRRPGTGYAIAIKALAPAVQVMGVAPTTPPHLRHLRDEVSDRGRLAIASVHKATQRPDRPPRPQATRTGGTSSRRAWSTSAGALRSRRPARI